MEQSDDKVTLTLGRPEALVLFELLADFFDAKSLPIPSDAERLALVRLAGALESTLTELFSPEYRNLIDMARAKLIAESGSV